MAAARFCTMCKRHAAYSVSVWIPAVMLVSLKTGTIKGRNGVKRHASVGVNEFVTFEIKGDAPECGEGHKNVDDSAQNC